jgi:hypothetical protein
MRGNSIRASAIRSDPGRNPGHAPKEREMAFLAFNEETVMNPDYYGYIGGRIEVYYPNEGYDRYEIRFFTKKVKQFNRFRNHYDGHDVTWLGLLLVRWIVRRWFSDE